MSSFTFRGSCDRSNGAKQLERHCRREQRAGYRMCEHQSAITFWIQRIWPSRTQSGRVSIVTDDLGSNREDCKQISEWDRPVKALFCLAGQAQDRNGLNQCKRKEEHVE